MRINKENLSYNIILFALYLWAVFSYISISALALHHALVFLSVVFLFLFNKNKNRTPLPKSAKMLIVFALLAVFSVIWNAGEIEKPFKNILRTKYLWAGAALFFLSTQFSSKLSAHKNRLQLLWLLSFLIAILYGFYCIYFAEPKASITSGFFGYYLSYSYLAQFGVLLIVFWALYPHVNKLSNKTMLLFWVFGILAAYNVYLNQARGPLLSLVVSLPFLLISKSRRVLITMGVLSLVVVASLGWYVSRPANTYINQDASGKPQAHRLFMSSKAVSNQMRISQYEMAWAVFKDSPVFGGGWRSLEQRSPGIKLREGLPYPEMETHAHNNFLEALSTTGVFGLIFYCLWLFYWFKESVLSNKSSWRAFYAAVIVAYVFSGLFQSTLIDSEVAFSLFAFYGLSPLFAEQKT